MAIPPGDFSVATAAFSQIPNNGTSITATLSTALTQVTQAAVDLTEKGADSWLGMMGHGLLATAKALPGILVWLITFTTITLPTVLFALFSTSLTFTMNFTTLYADSSLSDAIANKLQPPHRPRLRLTHHMAPTISLPQHVRPPPSRASAERTSNRPLPRYTRWRPEARSGQLPR